MDSYIIEETPYTVLRSDRSKKKGGGVMAIISDSIPFLKINIPKNTFFDILCFDIISPKTFVKNRFIIVYFPPSSKFDEQLQLANIL